ncbi:DEAD/DEAH box helicase [Thalassobacillus pellis]|uniref:DEAD/DEAH box helicase n=1 Tax=Thalassobacillus pellis TaxID=748008 RepID=UPI0019604354|nr:DEAD/DEAH box helicase [Thalassobacillus pellis]MBM7552102.1 superfamily II DNA or RNA helicase [Thalassobacillus pellis]
MEREQKLILNSNSTNLLKELTSSLETCDRFYFSVAFMNFSGIQLLLEALKATEKRGVSGQIITSTYLNFTDPKALEKVRGFKNVDLKVFVTDQTIGFHTKAYIFEYGSYYKVFIGSSNVTQSALKSNVEWNVEIISKQDTAFMKQVISEFQALWKRSNEVTEEFLHDYKEYFLNLQRMTNKESLIYEKAAYITPNSMQRRAMDNLNRLRGIGEKKALVIAATGTGKTYMSAFDVRHFRPKRLLFVVHREEILQKAKETFEKLMHGFDISFGLLTGTQKDSNADYIFANIRTLSNHYHRFNPHEFDYIIYDEAHHVTADSYLRVIDYFDPVFMLGMTATPERGDGHSIFDLFDQNVALEVRLHDALDDGIVVPFHYFGITDIDEIDLSNLSIDDVQEIARRLQINERVDFIIDKMEFYGHDGKKRKGLGFCATLEHARFMAEQFNQKGYPSAFLSGDDSSEVRRQCIKELENETNPLQFIFTVDIFNEGVDIPSVNTVLMLRPTNSPIVFIQQLGRGLRKYPDKHFLTVLDFIGNHTKAFLIAVALNGERYYDKESLKVAISTGFAHLPGATHIQMDKISAERILEQIDQEKFMSSKYLKEQYFEFKKIRQGKVPFWLMDYYKYDGAPDPVKFIRKENTYVNFIAKAEKDNELKLLLADDLFEKSLKWLSKMLPIKRPFDFVIIHYLLDHDSITLKKAKREILKWVEGVAEENIRHSMEFLNQDYFDTREKNDVPKLFHWDGEVLRRNSVLKAILSNPDYYDYFFDVIEYGLFRYEREFGAANYGRPHFKLYEQYTMAEVALLSNYRKSHSSFRGSGLLKNDRNYFLFVDLHKDADIDESVNYNDQFITPIQFQWETPNQTSQASPIGQNIIKNEENRINLHLFVRKYKEIERGIREPFIYIGKGNTISYSGNKPIEAQLELEQRVPEQLYVELTEKV